MVDDSAMLVVHIQIQVKPEHVEAFVVETRKNSQASLMEAGVARFDLVQRADEPTRFVLVEAYKTPEAPALHKQTAHYAAWRDAVEPMMQSPRTRVEFKSICPEEPRWSTPAE